MEIARIYAENIQKEFVSDRRLKYNRNENYKETIVKAKFGMWIVVAIGAAACTDVKSEEVTTAGCI